MTEPEALRCLAVLAAYFNRSIPDETAVLWARELVGYDVVDGLQAVQRLGRSAGAYLPPLGQLITEVRECSRDRALSERALPAGEDSAVSFDEWFAVQDDEMQKRAQAVIPMLRQAMRDEEARRVGT